MKPDQPQYDAMNGRVIQLNAAGSASTAPLSGS